MAATHAGHREMKSNASKDGELVKTAEAAVEKLGEQVEHELSRVREATAELAESIFASVRKHPRRSVALSLGVGALLGAAGLQLFFPRRTLSELIGRALNRGAISTGRSLTSGLKTARRLVG